MMMGASRSEIDGTWDAMTRTMTLQSNLADGNRYEGKHKFTSDGHAEARGKVTNPAGEVVWEGYWKQVRRKSNDGKKSGKDEASDESK